MDRVDKAALAAIGLGTGTGALAGSVTVAVTTTKILGLTVATTTVGLPVAGLVAAGGAVTYGAYKMWRFLRSEEPSGTGDPAGPPDGTAVPAFTPKADPDSAGASPPAGRPS